MSNPDQLQKETSRLVMLNLGCGRRFHSQWKNLDFVPMVDGVQVHNLCEPLPFEDGSVDACYTAHVLGHLKDQMATEFLAQQRRVLKPGGVVRFAVPDLAQVAENYLEILGDLSDGDRSREADYDWILIELYDQVARAYGGGKMGSYLTADEVPNRKFIAQRIGEEGVAIMDEGIEGGDPKPSLLKRLQRGEFSRLVQKLRLKVAELGVGMIAGGQARVAFKEGTFRNFSGEVQWRVYDRFSLGRELERAGFTDVKECAYNESRIPDFASFAFDGDESGVERKPESLYLEAIVPND